MASLTQTILQDLDKLPGEIVNFIEGGVEAAATGGLLKYLTPAATLIQQGIQAVEGTIQTVEADVAALNAGKPVAIYVTISGTQYLIILQKEPAATATAASGGSNA